MARLINHRLKERMIVTDARSIDYVAKCHKSTYRVLRIRFCYCYYVYAVMMLS